MDRIWTIPEEHWPEVGRMYRAKQWRSLTWVYNHYNVGGNNRICECEGSFNKMRILFEPFNNIYEAGDNELGKD